ncbi:craniofacial development protein 2-like [Nylanderia fulva]|uniref:craniofacial development protein 2-like n=1 Tax=Nylanderia fulva TaxID=613905 RepID=UPI0010FBB01C|nr:craniofacial development protein 2-like [Nylanderia fulva]
MKRIKIRFMGISELRWPGVGTCAHEGGTLYFSGSAEDDRRHSNGVGILVDSEFVKYVKGFIPISDRVMLLQLHGKPFDINLIQIYAPTSEKRYDDDVEVLYDTIRDTLQGLQSDNVNLVMGDFNAKIGQGRRTDIVGVHDLGESNERGDRLFEFCQETEMVVTNTWYKLSKRRLYTWKSPLDGGSNPEPVRNQIDYVLINKRFRNMVRSIKAYPGADIGSDHNPLVTDLTLRLKCVRSGTASKKIDVSKLRNIETRESATLDLNRKLSRIKEVNPTDVNTQWVK